MSMFDNKNLKRIDLKIGKLYQVDPVKIKAVVEKMIDLAPPLASEIWFDMEANRGSYHFWICPLYPIPAPRLAGNLNWEIYGSTHEYRHADTTVFDFASYMYLGTSSWPLHDARHMFLCKDRYVIFNLPGTSPYILKPMCENS